MQHDITHQGPLYNEDRPKAPMRQYGCEPKDIGERTTKPGSGHRRRNNKGRGWADVPIPNAVELLSQQEGLCLLIMTKVITPFQHGPWQLQGRVSPSSLH
jgi:hypothetical protein